MYSISQQTALHARPQLEWVLRIDSVLRRYPLPDPCAEHTAPITSDPILPPHKVTLSVYTACCWVMAFTCTHDAECVLLFQLPHCLDCPSTHAYQHQTSALENHAEIKDTSAAAEPYCSRAVTLNSTTPPCHLASTTLQHKLCLTDS